MMGEVIERQYDEIEIGETASVTKTITAELVRAFAEVSEDVNPMHLDADFAAGTVFGEPVAHGMLGASLISAVIGTRLPGPNSIYLGQELRFVAPVRYGDTLTATCEVVHKRDDKPILRLRTTVTNQEGQVVTEGEAVVKKPR
jgi:3-hydroxybutyryl-CoA dehydratase